MENAGVIAVPTAALKSGWKPTSSRAASALIAEPYIKSEAEEPMLFNNTFKKRNQLKFNDGLRPTDGHVVETSHNFAFVPPFAFNDEQLRTVLCHRAWRYVHQNQLAPASWDYAAVNRAATKKALAGHPIDAGAPEIQHQLQDKHIAAIKRAGGYMELQASIAYRAWREGHPSTEVAASLGVSPWMVRQSLRRLRAIGSRLGLEVGRRVHNFSNGDYDRPTELQKDTVTL
jgi:hypothetical protein